MLDVYSKCFLHLMFVDIAQLIMSSLQNKVVYYSCTMLRM